MFDSSLHIQNRIVTLENLESIFDKIHQEIERSLKTESEEKIANEKLANDYQEWTRKDYNGRMRFVVDFIAGNSITYENYQDFKLILNTRVFSIKRIYLYFSSSYAIQIKGGQTEFISQHINLVITETKMDVDVEISNKDTGMDEIYRYISTIIMQAPEKYDRLIKFKDLINVKVGAAVAFIPVIVLTMGLLFFDVTRKFVLDYYWAFPLVVLLFTVAIGILIGSARTRSIYDKLIPDKKYAGYDPNKKQSVYNEDFESYSDSGEVLIGKRAGNMELRERLAKMEKKSNRALLIELGFALVASAIILIMHFMVG